MTTTERLHALDIPLKDSTNVLYQPRLTDETTSLRLTNSVPYGHVFLFSVSEPRSSRRLEALR
jgi:hypothetical protein